MVDPAQRPHALTVADYDRFVGGVGEVLSPSTMDYDRGGKLKFYKSRPTLRHIALVFQDQIRVEHCHRTDECWRSEVLTTPDDVLRFDTVDFEIDVDRIYFDVPVLRPIMDAGYTR